MPQAMKIVPMKAAMTTHNTIWMKRLSRMFAMTIRKPPGRMIPAGFGFDPVFKKKGRSEARAL
jgi:hypothetical protein